MFIKLVPIVSLFVPILGLIFSSALFADSQSRLCAWRFGQPDRAYHLNELRRLSGASLQKRNLAEYEGYLEIEKSTVTEMCTLVQGLIADVQTLIAK